MQLPLIKLIAFLLPGAKSTSRTEDSRSPYRSGDCRGFLRALACISLLLISAGCRHKALNFPDDDQPLCNVQFRLSVNPHWEWSDTLLTQHIPEAEMPPGWYQRCILMVTDENTGRVLAHRSDIMDKRKPYHDMNVGLPCNRPLKVYTWSDIVDEHGVELAYDCGKFPVVSYADGRGSLRSRLCSMTAMSRIQLTANSVDTTLNITLHHHSGAFLLYGTMGDSLYSKADSIEAVICYEGFHPISFSIEQDAPSDAVPDHEVRCIPAIHSSGRMIIGGDCVWLPQSDEPRQKQLKVSFYNAKSGEWLGETPRLRIELNRGVIWVGECQLLPGDKPQGGIAIDPGFEGDINIRL